MRLSRSSMALVVALCLTPGLPLVAGPKGPRPRAEKPPKAARDINTPVDEFMRMSPQERQRALDRLPPGKRKRFEERLRRFNQLPEREQQTLKNMYNRLNRLPPERQQVVRRSLNQFSQQPPDSKQAIRQELRSLGAIAPEEREARMSSPEFRARFSQHEQEIIRNMSDLLPPEVR